MAFGAVDNYCISLLENVKTVLEIDIVLWILTEFGLLCLGVLSVELKVVLLNVFLGRWRNGELPFICLGLDELIAIASFANQAIYCLEIEVFGRAFSNEWFLLIKFIKNPL